MNWKFIIASASITACRGTGRHLVALEEDEDIFKALLQPMRKTTEPVLTAKVNEPMPALEASQDPDAMTMVPRKFARRNISSK